MEDKCNFTWIVHQPLEAIFGSKKGIPSLAAARLQIWSIILSAYDLKVKYRKAADVSHADVLSRLPLPHTEQIELEAKTTYLTWSNAYRFSTAVGESSFFYHFIRCRKINEYRSCLI